MQQMLFPNYGDVIDTSLEQRWALDVEGLMTGIVWIHQTHYF